MNKLIEWKLNELNRLATLNNVERRWTEQEVWNFLAVLWNSEEAMQLCYGKFVPADEITTCWVTLRLLHR